MGNNRRRYQQKPKVTIPCETCIELKYTPSFTEALQYVRNFPSVQATTDWYHLNGHTVFVE